MASRLNALRAELRERLGRFHVALDIETRLAERREAANQVFDALDEVVAAGGFGALLRALLIDVATLTEALHGSALPPSDGGMLAASRVVRPGIIARPGLPAAAPARATIPVTDREHGLARAAVRAWIGFMRRSIESEAFARRFRVPVGVMEVIVGELITLARRVNVEAAIAADLRTLATVERAEQSTAKLALIAATRLNRLCGDLGFNHVPPAGERPAIQEESGDRIAFSPRPVTYDARQIGPTPIPFGRTYVTDWFHGFYRVVEDNAKSAAGVTVNLEQNIRLGTILSSLVPRAA